MPSVEVTIESSAANVCLHSFAHKSSWTCSLAGQRTRPEQVNATSPESMQAAWTSCQRPTPGLVRRPPECEHRYCGRSKIEPETTAAIHVGVEHERATSAPFMTSGSTSEWMTRPLSGLPCSALAALSRVKAQSRTVLAIRDETYRHVWSDWRGAMEAAVSGVHTRMPPNPRFAHAKYGMAITSSSEVDDGVDSAPGT